MYLHTHAYSALYALVHIHIRNTDAITPPPCCLVTQQDRRDFRAARWMIENVGVATIPTSGFYSPEYRHLADNTIRFCFAKTDDEIDMAGERLTAWANAAQER